MTAVNATLVPTTTLSTTTVKWAGLTTGDAGAGVGYSDYRDRTVQVLGTFGGATVTIEGSNDGGTTWATLHDQSANALTFTSAGMKYVIELPALIRPSVSGGTSPSIDVWLHLRGRDQ